MDFQRRRVHRVLDRDCEACTKHYWTGGSELHECKLCGIMFEHEGDTCAHCENEENPLIEMNCGCVLTSAEDDDNVTLCEKHQQQLLQIDSQQRYYKALIATAKHELNRLESLRVNLMHQ